MLSMHLASVRFIPGSQKYGAHNLHVRNNAKVCFALSDAVDAQAGNQVDQSSLKPHNAAAKQT